MLAIVACLSLSFAGPPAPALSLRAARPVVMTAREPPLAMTTRRATLAAGAVSLAGLAALPRSALADDNDDAMAKIAAKAMEKNEAVKQKAKAKVAKDMAAGKVEKENAGSNVLIAAVGAGSVLFSLPFFYKSVARLALKTSAIIKGEEYERRG